MKFIKATAIRRKTNQKLMQMNINSDTILDIMRRHRRRDIICNRTKKLTSKLIADKTHTSVAFVDKNQQT